MNLQYGSSGQHNMGSVEDWEDELWGGREKGELSFERQRQRAARELERRGHPPSRPAALIERGAFRIPGASSGSRPGKR